MALLDWKDSFSVNVVEIDNQHRKLVSMINVLNDAMRERKTSDVLGEIIDDLINYAAVHFATEEKYFDLYDFPGKDSHKREHKAFVAKVSDVQVKFKEGRLLLSVDIMNFLRDWLTNHIQGTDKEYSAFFNGKGLK